MLEQFFHWPPQIARLRSNPGVEMLDAFAGHLIQCGYSRSQGSRHLRAAAHLLCWLDQQEFSFAEIDAATVTRFEQHLDQCRCVGFAGMHRDKLLRGIRAFATHREGRPLCTTTAGGQDDEHSPALWEPFSCWMREQRGTSERTLRDYRDYLNRLLLDTGDDPSKLDSAYG